MPPRTSRRTGWLRLALAVPLVVVGLEVTTRVGLALVGRSYDASRTHDEVLAIVIAVNGVDAGLTTGTRASGSHLHPYVGWEPGGVDERIVRELAHFQEHDDKCCDVLLLGSSVAAGMANDGGEVLAATIRTAGRLGGRPLRVFKHGRGAYKQPQQLMLLAHLLSIGFEPDAVICLDGFNELLSALQNHRDGIHPSYPPYSQWGVLHQELPPATDSEALEALVELERQRGRIAMWSMRLERYGLQRSAVAGSLVAGVMTRAQVRVNAARERFAGRSNRASRIARIAGPRFEGDSAEALREAVETWRRSVLAMHGMCAAQGIAYVHALQPSPNVPDSKVLTDDERLRAEGANEVWVRAVREGYPLLLEAAEDLARRGVEIADGRFVFRDVEETLWVDAGHLNERGSQLLAEYVGRALADQLGVR